MSIESSLTLIVDASGSMAESGKTFVAWNLCNYVLQRIRMGTAPPWLHRINLITWGDNVSIDLLDSDDLIACFVPQGRADLATLVSALESLESQTPDQPHRYLVLSDGRFQREKLQMFVKWIKTNANRHLNAICIGADADINSLKSMVANGRVFQAEDIATAIEAAFDMSVKGAAP